MWNIYTILSLSFIFDLTIKIPNICNLDIMAFWDDFWSIIQQ